MQFRLASRDFYLDGLILEEILSNFCASELATLSAVARGLRAPAQLSAHRTLMQLVQRLQASLLRHCQRGSWISQLAAWEAVFASNLLWIQAEMAHVVCVKQGDEKLVKRALDLSGHQNGAHMHQRAPVLRPNAINGHAAFDFDGSSVLKTKPFKQPLQQPITIMVVARARGDTTMIDSLGPQSARFELCHGYPSGWHPAPEICMAASGQEASPRQSMRGSTRSTGEWHVYTAIYDNKRSEVFVDGYCEASGKTAGSNDLDGLSLGCDHNGVFFLNGSLAEIRLFHCHIPTAQRVQTEAALAHRYGIAYSSAPAPPAAARSLSRFSCAPRSSRTSEVAN